MKIENFKSGEYRQQYQYKSFSPASINIQWTWEDPVINILLEQATQAISELNAFSLIVPNIDLFIQMHIAKEADTSSRIEGTQTTFADIFKDKDHIEPEKRDDWQEVRNYIDALNSAIDELKNIPLSNRLIKKTHHTLMESVRGHHKSPGEFRTSQNWIGGTTLLNAVFIPPHQDEVLKLMSDLESFLHNESIHVPHLIRIAIAHYQFETIHPFLDGNGRIGRLMIPLYLISKKFLIKPSLYVSDYLERHKGAYYDALTTVRTSSNLAHWIKFFLTAIIETSKKGSLTFQGILELRQETDSLVLKMGTKGKKIKTILDMLYKNAFITVPMASRTLGVSHQTANSLFNILVEEKIIHEMTEQKRNRIFVFDRYLKLFN